MFLAGQKEVKYSKAESKRTYWMKDGRNVADVWNKEQGLLPTKPQLGWGFETQVSCGPKSLPATKEREWMMAQEKASASEVEQQSA